MAADRAERPEAFQPLAPSFLTAELERIRSGVDLLAEGLLTEPLGADCEPTPAPADPYARAIANELADAFRLASRRLRAASGIPPREEG